MKGPDWPDVRWGFWVAAGAIAAMMLLALARRLLGRLTGGGRRPAAGGS